MSDTPQNQEPVGVRLWVAIKRLRARLREAAPTDQMPIAQLSIMKHLRSQGAATAAALADAEHVTQQAIAQNVAALKHAGLVQTTVDPADARKRLISITDEGNRLYDTVLASRNAWLTRAIDAAISPEERAALEKAIELLERLADAER